MKKENFNQKRAASEFRNRWKDRGYEKGEAQPFWLDLLQNVLEVENPVDFIKFEDQVLMDSSTGFMEGYISSTKVLV